MLTIKNDLYERILRQVDIKHCCDSFNKMYVEVNTIPQKWQLMVAECSGKVQRWNPYLYC